MRIPQQYYSKVIIPTPSLAKTNYVLPKHLNKCLYITRKTALILVLLG